MADSGYITFSTGIDIARGPTYIGNERSDLLLMDRLGGKLKRLHAGALDNHRYECPDDITTMMNKAKKLGYKVVGTAAASRTFIVTLEKCC